MMNSLQDIDEEANRLPENILQQERRGSDGIFKDTSSSNNNNNNHNTTTSRLSIVSKLWDIERKGYLTTSQRHARAADKDGKGYLSAEEARSMGSQIALLQDQYQRIQRNLKCVVCLLVILCGATITATYFAITGNNNQTMVDENGALMAADGSGTQVSVKSNGLKIHTYTMPSVSSASGNKVCISADDLALAWNENENGGVATFIIQSAAHGGGEQVLRVGGATTDARMTEEKVSFGNLELVPDPECAVSATTDTNGESDSNSNTMVGRSTSADDANRRLRENVQALREGRDIHRQLYMVVAFAFSDGDLC